MNSEIQNLPVHHTHKQPQTDWVDNLNLPRLRLTLWWILTEAYLLNRTNQRSWFTSVFQCLYGLQNVPIITKS